jgi:hypothetical protein
MVAGFGGSRLHIWDIEAHFELENNPSTHLFAWLHILSEIE